MKILLTGATGFIGSHIAKGLLDYGYDVFNTPDFTKVALAYGIESYSISMPEELETGLTKL